MEDSECTASKRIRKPNFSDLEVKILLEEIGLEKDIIQSSLINKATNKSKNAVWESIAKKVTACGIAVRTVPELKDKWGLLKRAAARKELGLDVVAFRALPVAKDEHSATPSSLESGYALSDLPAGTNTGVKAQTSAVEEYPQPCRSTDVDVSSASKFIKDLQSQRSDMRRATLTSQSLSSCRGHRSRRLKRTIRKNSEDDDLKREYLKTHIEESKLRQKKLALQLAHVERRTQESKLRQKKLELQLDHMERRTVLEQRKLELEVFVLESQALQFSKASVDENVGINFTINSGL